MTFSPTANTWELKMAMWPSAVKRLVTPDVDRGFNVDFCLTWLFSRTLLNVNTYSKFVVSHVFSALSSPTQWFFLHCRCETRADQGIIDGRGHPLRRKSTVSPDGSGDRLRGNGPFLPGEAGQLVLLPSETLKSSIANWILSTLPLAWYLQVA